MSALTLAEAAKFAGVSRPTIYRMVSEGKLSATVDAKGVKRVEASELKRVFPKARFETGETARESLNETNRDSHETGPDRALEVELRAARELLEVTRQALRTAEEREARLLGVVEAQTRMLEDRRGRAGPETPETPPPQAQPQSGPGNAGMFAAGIVLAIALWVAFSLTR